MAPRKRIRSIWTLATVLMAVLVLTSATQADIILQVDFNSNQDTGGDSTAAGDPGLSAANTNQADWSSYHANHEVVAEFSTADYGGITVTPAWPNTTANTVQQSIDRGSGNDGNWDDAEGYLNLVTDWIGIDTRTGNGNWDGSTGTPTYMTLTLGGLSGGLYEWTSFHHDTEHCHGPFAVWLSIDGGATFEQLDDGVMTDSTTAGTPDSGAVETGPDVYALTSTYRMSFVANGTDDVVLRFAPYSDAAGVHRQIWGMNGFELDVTASDKAFRPTPANGASDVLRSVVLSWTPADGTAAADGQKIFFSADLASVTDGLAGAEIGVLSNPEFDAASLPFALDYGVTYYWRVDNTPTPNGTWKAGAVWNFEVEPFSIKLPFDAIAVSASSVNTPNTDPNLAINGAGLDDPNSGNALHSNEVENVMWMSASGDPSPSLTFEFDTVQKLDQMLIWNSNHSSEAVIGWGIKDVDIQVSVDGADWTSIPDVGLITKNTGLVPSEAQAIDMGLATAKYVKLNILSNWGGLLPQYGVAEVQFYSLPMAARTPVPDSGSVDVHPGTVVSWRAGREASEHTVYVGTDMNAVSDGTASSVSSTTDSLDLSSLDLQLGQTYYWRVDEVNATEDPSVWAGPVWSLSTPGTLVVDDFESYSNISPKRPFQTWLDGFGYSPDEFFPVEYLGNGTGSGVGHDIWSVSSPHFDGSIMETGITHAGSGQSMPVYFNNSAGGISETTRIFADSQDWTQYGAQGLTLWFYGDPANTATAMYVKINNTRIDYPGDAADLQQKPWQLWYIDLANVAGVNLSSVTEMTLGFEGGIGLVYIDDIGLTPDARNLITPVTPADTDLVAHYAFEGNASDSTGANPGTVTGAPQYVAGKNGQAIKLNGAGDYVLVEGSFLLPTYSVSMWFRSEDLIGPADLMSLYSEDGGHGIILELSAEGALRYLHRFPFGTGGGNNVYSSPGYDDGAWYHLAAVKTEDTMTLYVNGQVIGSVADDTQFEAVPRFTMGVLKHDNLIRYVMGEMDDVYLYGRALSQAEVAGLAGRTSPFDN